MNKAIAIKKEVQNKRRGFDAAEHYINNFSHLETQKYAPTPEMKAAGDGQTIEVRNTKAQLIVGVAE